MQNLPPARQPPDELSAGRRATSAAKDPTRLITPCGACTGRQARRSSLLSISGRTRKVASVTDATNDTASFSATVAEGVLVAACELAGLDGSGARLLRLGENALFHLPAGAVVVRIARTMDYWPDAAKEVSVARWLAGAQFPATRVHPVAQPIEVSGHPVTFWRYIDGRKGSPADIADLGALLNGLALSDHPGF